MTSPIREASAKTYIFNFQGVHVQTLAFNIENRQENAAYASGRQGLLDNAMGKSLRRVLSRLQRCLPGFGCQRRGANTCMRTSSDRNETLLEVADRRAW